MIRIIENDFERINEVKKLCNNDVFGIRILSYLETYDLSLDFIDIWYQEDKRGNIVSIISRFCDKYTICAKYTRNRERLNEIKEFVSFRSPGSVIFDFKLRIDFEDNKRVILGDVLKFKKSDAHYKEIDLYKPDIEHYYKVLQKCASEDFLVPEYMYFLSDVTYRQNRSRVAMFGMKNENELASVCMTVSETENSVIMGAVATVPEFQHMGYCSKLLNAASSLFLLNGKDVYILSSKIENTKLYKKIGFKQIEYFIEYFF